MGKAMIWRIVASGPSLDWDSLMWVDWREEDYVMCINRAIIGAKFCHYWCCIDKPNKVHEGCVEDYLRLMPRLLTKKKRYPKWNVLLGPTALLENPYKHPKFADSWALKAQIGTSWSIIVGTAYAVAMGATEIYYYGVDLKGVGYHDGINPKGSPDEVWSKRFKKEIGCMRKLYQGSLEAGVALKGLPVVVTEPSKATGKK